MPTHDPCIELDFSINLWPELPTMPKRARLDRYALYGEGQAAIAPEFVHIEPVSRRSSLYEWTISAHSHPGIFQLLLLEAGSGLLLSDGAEVALWPTSLVALPSSCVHAFRFEPDAEGWVLSFAADLMDDRRIAPLVAAVRAGGTGPRWVQIDPAAAGARRLSWLLADLDAGLGESRAGRLGDVHAAQLALVLAAVGEELGAGAQAPGAGSPRDALVRRFRGEVDRHFREGWAVGRYAAVLGTTAPTLTRACREVLDKAPGEVVLDRVLLEAMRHLTYSTASVSQIAGDLGFADPAYFARFFKARAGMTASEFRSRGLWLRMAENQASRA